MIPQMHQNFIDQAMSYFKSDERFIALLGAGSMINKEMDQFSDIDFVVVVKDADYPQVMIEKMQIVQKMDNFLSAFTGEHVGEPRLLICLFKNPLLHIDIKFTTLGDLNKRVENPVILFEKSTKVSELLNSTPFHFPTPDAQWIEDRFWTWIHYAALKLGRGELFEVIDFLAYLRQRVFGPLVLMSMGERPSGVRRIEKFAPDYAELMKKTVATHDRVSCAQAIESSIDLYKKLRMEMNAKILERPEVEIEAVSYFKKLI